MKFLDMLADVADNPPQTDMVNTIALLHEPEVEDLFHKMVAIIAGIDGGYGGSLTVGVEWLLYAICRHGLPDDLHELHKLEEEL